MPDQTTPPFLIHAINDGLVKLTGEGKAERIHYVAAGHSERWADPEEKVRAEFRAELIYKYEYRPERIRFEVKVPRRTPNDLAARIHKLYAHEQECRVSCQKAIEQCKLPHL